MRRPRATILVKLLVALVLPTLALFTLFAFVAYEMNRRDLDEELGRRLIAIAQSAATQIRGRYVVNLLPDEDNTPNFTRTVGKLEAFANATGAHLSLIDRDYKSRGDSEDVRLLTALDRFRVDDDEIQGVFRDGTGVASVTFDGQDGKTYKAGYAPVRFSDDDVRIVLVLRAEAPASYFETLEDLRDRLFLWGAGLGVVSIFAAVIATLLITRNVRRLVGAAERIGAGELRERVEIKTDDELGQLGQAMEHMRQQLAERDARMQQMLAGIAHEVRNPLAGMTLFAGILKDELPEGDERRGHVDKINRELGYLERVVNDFLEYARRPKPELAPVDIDELLPEVAQLITNDEVTVKVEPDSKLVANADRGQLRRALLNLTKNAVQAAIAAGHRGADAVKLSATTTDDELHILVWNRGKEIPAETSGKLFEPFYTTREKGTGLGLAFVREIAADHGGRIDVKSADGQTTFTLVIPASR